MTPGLSRRAFLAAAAGACGMTALRADSPVRLSAAGFLDLQVNGFAGIDFNDPALTADQLHQALAAMRRTGVTQALPTLITAPLDRFAACARTIVRAGAPGVLGIHAEGPYISPEDGARGAHAREHTRPASLEDFQRRMDAAEGRIRVLTVAPEVPGVLPVIEHAVSRGVRVAIGHTAATPEQVREAVRAGASLSTHLGNGAAQLLPRHPNFIWEQLAADELVAGLIVDGHHLPPATVKAMVRAKSPERVVLVTDAIAAAGRPPGEYKLGDLTVRLEPSGRVAVPGAPNLAGSALTLDRAVANVVRFAGVSIQQALAMAAEQPARAIGVQPRGSLDLTWDAAAGTLEIVRVRTD